MIKTIQKIRSKINSGLLLGLDLGLGLVLAGVGLDALMYNGIIRNQETQLQFLETVVASQLELSLEDLETQNYETF